MYVVLVEIVLPQVDWEIMPKQMNILWKYETLWDEDNLCYFQILSWVGSFVVCQMP